MCLTNNFACGRQEMFRTSELACKAMFAVSEQTCNHVLPLSKIQNVSQAMFVPLTSFTLFFINTQCFNVYQSKGGFSVIAEITQMLAANTRIQPFIVITTTASTRCLVANLLFAASKCCYTVIGRLGHSSYSKWSNDRLAGVTLLALYAIKNIAVRWLKATTG